MLFYRRQDADANPQTELKEQGQGGELNGVGESLQDFVLDGSFFGDGVTEFKFQDDALDVLQILHTQRLIQPIDAPDVFAGLRIHVGVVEDVGGIPRSSVDEKEVDGQQAKE